MSSTQQKYVGDNSMYIVKAGKIAGFYYISESSYRLFSTDKIRFDVSSLPMSSAI